MSNYSIMTPTVIPLYKKLYALVISMCNLLFSFVYHFRADLILCFPYFQTVSDPLYFWMLNSSADPLPIEVEKSIECLFNCYLAERRLKLNWGVVINDLVGYMGHTFRCL